MMDMEAIRVRPAESLILTQPDLGEGYEERVLITVEERDSLMWKIDQLTSALDGATRRAVLVDRLQDHLRLLTDKAPDPATMCIVAESPWMGEARRLVEMS